MTTTQKEVKASKRAANAPARKALVEKAKTMLIVVSIAVAAGFALGNNYASNRQHNMQAQVNNAIKAAAQSKN